MVSYGLGFRYKAEYVKEYIEAAQPVWGVGEYWDTCAYTEEAFRLDYNQGECACNEVGCHGGRGSG